MHAPTPTPRRKGSIVATVKAVLWGFLGIRRQADYQKDVAGLSPLHVMAVGGVLALLFVLALILIVKWVVA